MERLVFPAAALVIPLLAVALQGGDALLALGFVEGTVGEYFPRLLDAFVYA
ncbi:hypothetical protein D3C76_1872850 [compost metagenome]